MRNFVQKILKMLNFSGREWMAFLLALLLAFCIWLVHKLSLDYNVYLNVDVIAESNIEGRARYSSSAVPIMAKCRTSGWRVLYAYLTRETTVTVNFPSSIMRHDENDRYYISSDRLHEYVQDIFGDKVSVDYFVADHIFFDFREEVCKKVPVKPVSSLSFEDQYLPSSELQIIPDSVIVYGDALHLEALDHVTTSTIRHSDISEDINGMISLTPINDMRYSNDEVHYKMDVVRYVEILKEGVPVKVINVPSGKSVVADPSEVNLLLECEFPLKSDPGNGIELTVDYEEFSNSISGNVMVRHKSLPYGTIKYEVSPAFVRIRNND